MPGLVEIYNLALSAAHARASISSTTEASREAEVANLWYEPTRDMVFRAAFWPGLRGVRSLALLATRDDSIAWAAGDPPDPWKYAYALPSDCLRARYLSTFGRFTTGLYTPAGVTPSDGSSPAIFTNQPSAVLEYTVALPNTELWDSSLTFAVVYALAAHVAGPLSGKESIIRKNFEMAQNYIMEARVAAANEQDFQMETIPDWIEARGYAESSPRPRFIFPYGQFYIASTDVQSGNV